MNKSTPIFIWSLVTFLLLAFAAMGIYDSVTYAEAMAWEKVETTREGDLRIELWVHKATGEEKRRVERVAFFEEDLRMLLQEDKR